MSEVRCSRCGGPTNTKSYRADFPGKYISMYEYSKYPMTEAKGLPVSIWAECYLCGWRTPILPKRIFILWDESGN